MLKGFIIYIEDVVIFIWMVLGKGFMEEIIFELNFERWLLLGGGREVKVLFVEDEVWIKE